MPADRFFHRDFFKVNQHVILENAEAHHLTSVMRARLGDRVELVNGKGQLASAELKSFDKKHAHLDLIEVVKAQPALRTLILAQAIPKMNRLEYIVEKVTELGISEIWLFPGMRSERQELSPNQLERVEMILINALKQCGRLFLPKIAIKPSLKKWMALPFTAFFGDIRDAAPSFGKSLAKYASQERLLFFIGPESGFTEEEIKILEELHVEGVSLHTNILRTDTAAITAACLMSQINS